ncbi:MAG: hypothetical protein MJ252_14795 [archaeon]|nr:hypothetical protein [archaeon]
MNKTSYSNCDRSLGRTVKGSMPQYWADGCGRDWYIAYDNAGLWKDGVKKISSEPKYEYYKPNRFYSLKHQPAPWRYYNDGSGRDMFISYNCGGLVKLFTSDANYNNQCLYRSTVEPEPLRQKPTLSKQEMRYQEYLRSVQNGVINRLYTKERNKMLMKLREKLLNKKKRFDPLLRIYPGNEDIVSPKFKKSSSCSNFFPKIRVLKAENDGIYRPKPMNKNSSMKEML